MPDGGVAPRTVVTPASWDEDGWNRAYDRGYAEGLRSVRCAVVFIERAGRLLSHVPHARRQAIWQQAIFDVEQEHGDLPVVITRAMAARRIARFAALGQLRELIEAEL